jgi:hypothetical protein
MSKTDWREEKLGESREGLRKCPVCGEWSVLLRDGLCHNENCDENN